jgi:hypothetical protein
MTMLRRDRLNKGLCPHCGAEAAPYRECETHRFQRLLGRILRRMEARGFAQRAREGHADVWSRVPGAGPLPEGIYREAQEGDKRLQPRLHHVPVDIEQTLKVMFTHLRGGPVTEAEILAAWSKLRERKGRVSAAQDLALLILAQRKRERRATRGEECR